MKFFIAVLLLFSVGCSVFANELPSQSSIILAFGSTNETILGEAQDIYKDDISRFTLQEYKDFLYKHTAKQPTKIKVALPDFDVQEFQSYEHTFVFCVFSSKEKFAMCDDPHCVSVEEKGVGVNKEILDSWKKKLPLDKCPER